MSIATIGDVAGAGGTGGETRRRFQMPDPLDRNASAAQRLSDAIVCLLIERGTELLADGLKPADVTERAGKARASYYRTEGFPAGDERAVDSRRAVLERTIVKVLAESAADVEQVVGSIRGYIEQGWVSESPRAFVRETSEANFDELNSHTSVIQALAAVLVPSSRPIGDALDAFYRDVTASYVKAYKELLRFWGYRIRPPLTLETATMALMALAEGLMLRSIANADVDRTTYGEILSLYSASLFMPAGDVSSGAALPNFDLAGEVPPPTRADIIGGLVRMFEGERVGLPTSEELAEAVGCTPHTIGTQFGGVVGVIRAAWDEWVPEFEEVAERNRRLLRESDPMTVLYRVALAVAIRSSEKVALTRALLMSEVGLQSSGMLSRPEPIAAIFGQLVGEAVSAGHLSVPSIVSGESDADRALRFGAIVRSAVLATVGRTPVAPGSSPAAHAKVCVDYVWALMVPARRSCDAGGRS